VTTGLRPEAIESDEQLLGQVMDDAIAPDHLIALSDQCRRLLESLPDDTLRQVARWKLEGYTNGEIAEQLGVAKRTVERKLNLIRRDWSEEEA
jgi:DNA-directed RNA polymerase specialized sigma24 family protein